MKKISYILCAVLAAIVIIISCKKPYTPSAINEPNNYLVVEGIINSGADSTVIKLSRTVNLSGKTSSNPELNAQVTVESDQNAIYLITSMGNGKYASPSLNLDNTHKYRLRIKTIDNREYLSDLVEVRVTPPIDSVGFTVMGNGVQIYANTHDPNNNTRYYRWDYNETWQFNAKYPSDYVSDGKKMVLRTPEQRIYSCFGNAVSSSIVLGSSARLSQDVIYQTPLTQVSSTSEKLETKYSILVKQYALTKEAYDFWQNIKKNTEQLGSIFDALPSNLSGNIHCTTDPNEPVIGYISVSNMQQKRIFITNEQLPSDWRATYPYECEQDSLLFCRLVGTKCYDEVTEIMIPLGSATIATSQLKAKGGPDVIGYYGTSRECADCTIRGVVKKPDFWK